jgi:hypothetical protein
MLHGGQPTRDLGLRHFHWWHYVSPMWHCVPVGTGTSRPLPALCVFSLMGVQGREGRHDQNAQERGAGGHRHHWQGGSSSPSYSTAWHWPSSPPGSHADDTAPSPGGDLPLGGLRVFSSCLPLPWLLLLAHLSSYPISLAPSCPPSPVNHQTTLSKLRETNPGPQCRALAKNTSLSRAPSSWVGMAELHTGARTQDLMQARMSYIPSLSQFPFEKSRQR